MVWTDSPNMLFANNQHYRACDGVAYFGVSLLSTTLAGNKYLNWVLCGFAELPAYLTLPVMMNT